MTFKKYIGSVVKCGLEASVRKRLISRNKLSFYCKKKYVFGEPERVETNTVAEFEGCPEYKSEYHAEPPFACEVSDVTMFGPGGTVVTRDGKILFESARNLKGNLIGRFVTILQDSNGVQRLLSVYKRIYAPWLLKDKYDFELAFPVTFPTHNSYYHWVMEYLPKLRTLERYQNVTGNNPIIIIDANPPNWMRESIELLTEGEIVEQPESTIRVKKLVLPLHRNHHPNDFNPWPTEYQWLRSKMYDAVGVDDPGGNRRIYISREDADRRRVINETAVINCLEECGFEAHRLSDLRVREQVKLFAEAEKIVAPHGAGLVNMIFSSECEIFELIPEDLVFPFYHCLADHIGHKYEYLCCDGKNGDIIVDIQRLQSWTQEILS